MRILGRNLGLLKDAIKSNVIFSDNVTKGSNNANDTEFDVFFRAPCIYILYYGSMGVREFGSLKLMHIFF